ncbi:unnamed protein product [Clonostachys rhizophaga]|uniref:Uncharacterized protein n=1 Tax=Clonostachys rhizophaga TaxID=160324 RepID=A0A9N9YJ75_9HYPO|nr:unnamed protein product [Clonostachys rhizophaga]
MRLLQSQIRAAARWKHSHIRTISTAIHQPDRVPWNTLVSNLQYDPLIACKNGRANLKFRFQHKQGISLNYFVDSLIQFINEQADELRRTFPENYEIPSSDDVVISDEVVMRILPLVHAWRSHCWNGISDKHEMGIMNETIESELCLHAEHDKECKCALPLKERKMAAFLRQYEENDCYCFMQVNGEAFFNLEITKTLLIQGEIETILNIFLHPNVDYSEWWNQAECHCNACEFNIGLDQIYNMALRSYITLNALLHFSQLLDHALSHSEDANDYRRLFAYQKMIRETTKTNPTTEVATYPHRQFFGIAQPQLHDSTELRETTRSTEPAKSEKPLEVVGVPRGLVVPHDPFHPDNLEELRLYLENCWKLILRCVILDRAQDLSFGDEIDTITKLVNDLGSCGCCGGTSAMKYGPYGGKSQRWMHRFV